MRLALAAVLSIVAFAPVLAEDAEPPQSVDQRLRIHLYAESPQIVTPTGLDVDALGRVWAIESNTHFPPEGYAGHPSDRVLVMSGMNADGRARRIDVFADGLTHAMSVAVRPSGEVFVATRKEIFRYSDVAADLKPDGKERVIFLDTPGDYPHNGLAGFAFDALGWMYFGCGENLGADYKLIGSDGITLSGGGEGGNIYRCRLDGSELTLWATGFWNPHASCFDAFGRLFTVDNDPDSRPPCRLLHIIPGGDYGYRFRNGRRGTHPFTAWDGEIPGTLPMVAGTGEAPSGIVAYESDGLPSDYLGNLIATSWGDHRLERFQLSPKGASFTSRPEPIIQGGENFRPVGLAVAPDGSLYCTDWVLKEYKLHGQGRIWRISAADSRRKPPLDVSQINRTIPFEELDNLLWSPRMDVRRAAAGALAATIDGTARLMKTYAIKRTLTRLKHREEDLRPRVEAVWALQSSRAQIKDEFVPVSNLFDKADEAATAALWDLGAVRAKSEVELARDIEAFTESVIEQLAALAKEGRPAEGDPIAVLAALYRCHIDLQRAEVASLFETSDPFVFAMLVHVASRTVDAGNIDRLLDPTVTKHPRARLGLMLAARRRFAKADALAAIVLDDPDVAVRRAAVQWVGEERLQILRPQLEGILGETAITADLFEATLTSLELIDGLQRTPEEWAGSQYVLRIVRDDKRPAAVRAQALRMLSPSDKGLDAVLLRSFLDSGDKELRLEAVRTLQQSPLAEASTLLQSIAQDKTADRTLRLEAIAGLGSISVGDANDPVIKTLIELLRSMDREIQVEVIRSLRGSAGYEQIQSELWAVLNRIEDVTSEEDELFAQLSLVLKGAAGAKVQDDGSSRPKSNEEWLKVASEAGNADAGRRVFFHTGGAGCYRCHTVNGRGGRIGPDLSTIARSMNRNKLAESIVEPSKEIAPQFVSFAFVTNDGKVHTGMILRDDRQGKIEIGTPEGTVIALDNNDIERPTPQKASLMPEKLTDRMTPREFRDLVAYLETLK